MHTWACSNALTQRSTSLTSINSHIYTHAYTLTPSYLFPHHHTHIFMFTYISIYTCTLTHILISTHLPICHMSSFSFPKSEKNQAIHLPSIFCCVRTITKSTSVWTWKMWRRFPIQGCKISWNLPETHLCLYSVRNSGWPLMRHLKMTYFLGSFHLLKAIKRPLTASLAKVNLSDGAWPTDKGERSSTVG